MCKIFQVWHLFEVQIILVSSGGLRFASTTGYFLPNPPGSMSHATICLLPLPTAYCLLNLRYPDSAFERIEILESYHDNDGHYHSGNA